MKEKRYCVTLYLKTNPPIRLCVNEEKARNIMTDFMSRNRPYLFIESADIVYTISFDEIAYIEYTNITNNDEII